VTSNLSPKRVVLRRCSLARACDLAERAIVLVVYLLLVMRIFSKSWESGQFTNLLLLPSEGLVVVFLLVRRETREISLRWQDWLLAISATLAPLIVEPGSGAPLAPPALAAGFLLMGLILQIHAKMTLGRSFGCVPAHRGLQLAGPYQFVRHPMYAGYLLGHVAFLLVNPTWRNFVVYTICYALQVPRLLAEERWLAHDPDYRAYQASVKYRLVPGVF
jgi:protein-S-isoprenylcysteine O-methyltransferase Ste14